MFLEERIEELERRIKELEAALHLPPRPTKAAPVILIQYTVATHFGIELSDMTSKARPDFIATPRMVAMYITREVTRRPITFIAKAFSKDNHTTVSHACKTVKNRCDTEPKFAETVKALITECRQQITNPTNTRGGE